MSTHPGPRPEGGAGRILSLAVGAIGVGTFAWMVMAGDVNPPTGTVVPTGKTTQEIFDAVGQVSAGVNGLGRMPGVPGASYSDGPGTAAFNGTASQSFDTPILGVRFAHAKGSPQWASTGPFLTYTPAFGGYTLIREMGNGDVPLFRAFATGATFSQISVSLVAGGKTTVHLLTTARVTALRHHQVQRADGTFAAIEEIDLEPASLRVTDPTGKTWQYTFATNVVSP